MHFEGQQTIHAPIETVWAYLTDPHKVAACTPGFHSMEILAPDHFKPTVAVGIGSVKAKFTLDVMLVDLQPPHHAVATARGVAAGSAAEMRGSMDLTAESDQVTTMRWFGDVEVMGTIANVGARLMDGTAQKLTTKFFDCLRQDLEAPATGSPT
jgi:carbon monoxide dehydrogenase subunit G